MMRERHNESREECTGMMRDRSRGRIAKGLGEGSQTLGPLDHIGMRFDFSDIESENLKTFERSSSTERDIRLAYESPTCISDRRVHQYDREPVRTRAHLSQILFAD